MIKIGKRSWRFSFAAAAGFAFFVLALLAVWPGQSHAASLGPVTDITQDQEDGRVVEIAAGKDKVRVMFYRDDIVRIWLGVGGDFQEPQGNRLPVPAVPIVVKQLSDFPQTAVSVTDEGDYYKLSTAKVALRVYKNPLRFAMYKQDNRTLLWEETESIAYGTSTVQTLARGEDEYFFGGGVQHGRFSHRDQTIKIEFGGGWDDGGVSNPAPFYWSTNGYGVLRNTFQPGTYSFKDPIKLAHNENRFDAFYFYGETIEDILNAYTDITGKPHFVPRWALGLGDANCYNRAPQTTPVVIDLIAKKYRELDMPGSWILPNDGYGCGYTDLQHTVEELRKLGFYTGLWTEDGVERIAQEVGEYGIRAAKLDVAWVGPGYDFALQATKMTYDGIENNSDARAYIWSVGGWAGTQRYSAVWTGDQAGNWEYIRFHIPTYIGAGLSGIPYIASDVDGIFGGSAKTQVRDIQWKMFTPLFLNMSGWAPRDKQPWVWGEPYTSINRQYLKLRQRLIPYFYTYLHRAYETGAPLVRAMLFEFPDDPNTKGTLTQYQFMSGEWFLVAPVYRDAEVRHNIYLPKGKWIDYWTGTAHYGSKMLNDYSAPLDRLPLLVRAGAIIPMYPESLYDGQVPPDPITFELFPYKTSRFELYEDDGVTREHRQGRFAKTLIESIAPETGTGDLIVRVGASRGEYDGKPASRRNHFLIHMPNRPQSVALNDSAYPEYKSKEQWENAEYGWYYSAEEKAGILYVKTPPISADEAFELVVGGFVADETPLEDPVPIELPGADPDPARIPQEDLTASASASEAANPASHVLDGDLETIWSTPLDGSRPLPQSVTIDLGIEQYVNRVKVLPPQYGGEDGIITKYKLYVSSDGTNFTQIASGDWPINRQEKTIEFETVLTRYVRLEAAEGVGGVAAITELNVYVDPKKPAPVRIPKEEMTASAYSFQPGNEPSKAIDGDQNTMWHTKWDGSDRLPQSIVLDLGRTRRIVQFRYGPRLDAGNGTITSYKLYVSLDGTQYTEVAGGTWERNNSWKYVQLGPMAARYVKLEAIEAVGGFASARELDVYEEPEWVDDEIKNISEGKPAAADSEHPSHPAGNANDGDETTMWAADDAEAGHAWSVDLGKNHVIRSLEISFEHADKAYQYKLEVREAGNPNWITVVDRTNNTQTGSTLVDEFGSKGRYVRLTVTGVPEGERAAVRELRLFGMETNTGRDGEFATGVRLDRQQVDLFEGGAYEILKATVEPATALNQNVIWSSSNPQVAAVDDNGTVYPVAEGQATITVTTEEGGWTAQAEVTVHPASSYEHAGGTKISQSQMTATATSEQAANGESANKAIDGDPSTMWHVRYFAVDPLPQSITVALGGKYVINQLNYLPRQTGGTNGIITMFNVYVSTDGVQFRKVASGIWANDRTEKTVSFPAVPATHVKLEAVEGVAGMASAAEINIYEAPPAEEPAAASVVLDSPAAVEEGDSFVVQIGLNNVEPPATAQDIMIVYNADLFTFVKAEPLALGVKVLAADQTEGRVRILLFSEGKQHAVQGDSPVLELHFKAAESLETQSASGRIEARDVTLADETGTEYALEPDAAEITISKKGAHIPGDFNGDGKVSIGDLAIVGKHYGKHEGSPGWEEAKRADFNGDGRIDIEDLTAVALLVLNQ